MNRLDEADTWRDTSTGVVGSSKRQRSLCGAILANDHRSHMDGNHKQARAIGAWYGQDQAPEERVSSVHHKGQKETSVAATVVGNPCPNPRHPQTDSNSNIIEIDGLSRSGMGMRERLEESHENGYEQLEGMKDAVRASLGYIEENQDREGLAAALE